MPRKKVSKYLQSIAYHEAGHAIAAWNVGMEPRVITIIPDDTSDGRYLHHPYLTDVHPDWDNSPEVQRLLENRALVSLAGGAAQRRFNPRGFRWANCRADHEQMQQTVLFLTGGDPGEEFTAYWKLIEVRANNLVAFAPNWKLISAVARALVRHRQLSGDQLLVVIDATQRTVYR